MADVRRFDSVPSLSADPTVSFRMAQFLVLHPRPCTPRSRKDVRHQVSILFPGKVSDSKTESPTGFQSYAESSRLRPQSRPELAERSLSEEAKMDVCVGSSSLDGSAVDYCPEQFLAGTLLGRGLLCDARPWKYAVHPLFQPEDRRPLPGQVSEGIAFSPSTVRV